MGKGLVDYGDELVANEGCGNSREKKLIEDVSFLVNSVKNRVSVPRVLLKNGKSQI